MQRSPTGFSLFECLLVLAILSVVLLAVVPYGYNLYGKNRALAYLGEVRAALMFTRASAILLGQEVKLCGSKDHKKCDGLWNEGQIVVTDKNKVLRVLPKVSSADNITWRSRFEENQQIVFLPTGFLRGRQLGSFRYYVNGNSRWTARLKLYFTGKTKIILRS